MQNPERMTTDGVNIWVFHCEGPGPDGAGCPIFREDVAPTQNQAELDALQGRWEIVEGHWHCPRCVRRVDDALYGVETRLEPEKTSRPPQEVQSKQQGLTAITIENFKGIGQAVTIPLRPVTLLFGANSAGKSTIIQALQYAWEILENRNADIDRTRLGGDVIDLGGFRNLVHGRIDHRSIMITLHYAGELKDEAYRAPEFFRTDAVGMTEIVEGKRTNISDWLEIEDVGVRVTASWEPNGGAYISAYEVIINGHLFGYFKAGFESTPVLQVNVEHPFLSRTYMETLPDEPKELLKSLFRTFASASQSLQRDLDAMSPTDKSYADQLKQVKDARAAEEFAIIEGKERRDMVPSVIPHWGRHLSIQRTGSSDMNETESAPDELIWILSQILVGAGETVLNELRGMRYIGPLRVVPERGFNSPLRPDAARWANGLGGWDCLLRSNSERPFAPDLIDRCNHYLNDVLHLGYTVRRDSCIQLPDDSAILSELRLIAMQYDERDGGDLRRRVLEPLEHLPRVATLQLYDEKREIDVEPMDIGVGVSQTLPVVVGAVEPHCTIFAVEQPELHIHPAVQVGLGDLFLREALSGSRKFLVETHSEHLVLRMMKRMRETCEGTLPDDFPEVTPEDVAILYVETIDGKTYVREMPLNERGELIKAWPGGFFEEALRETF